MPWPPSSCTLAISTALRLRLGARVIQLPSGQHADDLRVGVLRDLADERLAVGVGHPVLGLDFLIGVDTRLKAQRASGRVTGCGGNRLLAVRVERLRVHQNLRAGMARIETQ